MAGTPSSSTVLQQQFGLDSFDFSADFAMPSAMDELNLFQHQQESSSSCSQNVLPQSDSSTGHTTSRPAQAEMDSSLRHHQPFSPSSDDKAIPLRDAAASSAEMLSRLSTLSSMQSHGSGADTYHDGLCHGDLSNLLMAIQASPLTREHTDSNVQNTFASPDRASGGRTSALAELERYLREKEHTERMQNLETALLRQQLESLQRGQQSRQHTSTSSVDSSSSHNLGAAHLMQQFQQMSSQQSSPAPFPLKTSTALSGLHTPAGMSHEISPSGQSHVDSTTTVADTYGLSSDKVDLSTLTEYGLVTPIPSGAFAHPSHGPLPFVSPVRLPSGSHPSNSVLPDAHRSYDGSVINGIYTPMESPAITPASVFSNVGGAFSSHDVFSPLTSPALRPFAGQVKEDLRLPASEGSYHTTSSLRSRAMEKASPYAGPQGKKSTTPGQSPSIVATKSVPRKNRSTTAEARANRARPSPLVKPTSGSATSPMSKSAASRKRGESISANGKVLSPVSATASQVMSKTQSTGSRDSSVAKGTMVKASATQASSSDNAASTPSPIDLNGALASTSNGVPMTPSTMMGIQTGSRNDGSHRSDRRTSGKGKAGEEGARQVTFSQAHATSSPSDSENLTTHAGVTRGESASAAGSDGPGTGKSHLSDRAGEGSGLSGMAVMTGSGSGLESRRTSHKAAEQKRRDSLKYCFDELRDMLPAITLDDDAPGGSSLGPDGLPEDQEAEEFHIDEVGDEEAARLANRAISKVALLRHSNEYLLRLKSRLDRRNQDLDFCRKQIVELQMRLGYHPTPQDQLMPLTMNTDAMPFEVQMLHQDNPHTHEMDIS